MRRPPLAARLLFSLLLVTYPRAFRTRFGVEMRRFFDESYDEHVRGVDMRHFWLRTYWLLFVNGVSERLDDLRRRVRAQRSSRSRLYSNERVGVTERTLGLARNLWHGVRSLRSSPGFALTSVLTLGLAIGACTMIFSVAYPVLLSPLPYPQAGEIASLYEKSPGPDGVRGWASPLTVRDWQERSKEFERIVSYGLNIFTWTGGPEPALLRGWAVSAGYFPLMGLGMTLGRGFTPDEDEPGGDRVVVLSHSLWSQHFGSDRDVLGRSMTLDGAPYTMVGVAHRDIAF
ncbi:MAG: ABC transporter permease, partial [Gemmatimonadota bacterium]